MAELLTLARPYAKAAFDYASEQNNTQAWLQALQLLSATVQDTAFFAYINRPELTSSEKVQAFLQVLADKTTTGIENFLTLLAQNDRLALLPEVETEYALLNAKSDNTRDVVIESAYELTNVQKQLIVDRLEKRFQCTVNAMVEINPDLIAGAVIRIGDQVIDDSVRNKLEKMRTQLLA